MIGGISKRRENSMLADWNDVTRSTLCMVLFFVFCNSYANANDHSTEVNLHFVEASPNKQFIGSINNAFEKGTFLRFRYAPLGTLEGKVDRQTINSHWTYSVTQNCFGPCSKLSSAIRDRISTARRIAEECPSPYQISFQILDASEVVIESIVISLDGMCLTFRDQSYAVTPSNAIGKALMKADFDGVFLIH
jgi:hypothetical protein